jgi:hypothetical protein
MEASSSAFRRATGDDANFDRAAHQSGLSPEGAQWVRQALDPCHDVPRRKVGLPDTESGRTVIYDWDLAVDVNGSAVGATWDCHVAVIPVVSYNQGGLYDAGVYTYNKAVPGAGTLTFAAPPAGNAIPSNSAIVVICSTAAGGTTFDPSAGGAGAIYQTLVLDHLTDDDLVRLVSGGLEVINTTSELYKQGEILAYCQEVDCAETSLPMRDGQMGAPGILGQGVEDVAAGNATDYGPYTGSALVTNAPPSTIAQARMAESVEWEAKHGGYMPLRRTDFEGDAVRPAKCPSVLLTGIDTAGQVGSAHDVWVTPHWIPGTAADLTIATGINFARCLPYAQCGFYLTNLSTETALKVRFRGVTERFASVYDVTTMSIAQPSPAYDHLAWTAYNEVLKHLPIAVKFNLNPAGEWWRKIVQTARAVMPTVNAFLKTAADVPGPLGEAGQGLLEMSRGVDRLLNMNNAPADQSKAARRRLRKRLMKSVAKPKRSK